MAKGIDTVPAPELAATIRAMKLGRAKAVIYDSSILSYYLNQSGNTSLQLAGPVSGALGVPSAVVKSGRPLPAGILHDAQGFLHRQPSCRLGRHGFAVALPNDLAGPGKGVRMVC